MSNTPEQEVALGSNSITSAQKEEAERVLNSRIFSRAPAQAKLLKYICDEYFGGRADNIKEYALATDVFGKPTDFDQNQDAIVRVEAHRLRKKLKEYYEGDGAGHDVQIVLEPGSYVPHFVRQSHDAPEPLSHEADSADYPEPSGDPPATVEQTTFQEAGGAQKSRLIFIAAGITAIAVLVLAGFLIWLKRGTPQAESAPSEAASLAPVTASIRPLDAVRILAGDSQGKYTDKSGAVWGPDRFFTGGEEASQSPQFIARTMDDEIYKHWREGEFSYDIPLKPGIYELHLYFNEPEFGPQKLHGGGEASRIFNIELNGKSLLFQFDILGDIGMDESADEKVFTDVSPAADGFLHLKFTKQTDYPLLNAIEIIPGRPGKMSPVRIVASDSSYTDHQGNLWLPDHYFFGGRLTTHNVPIGNTADPDLFTNQRFGNFSYSIPVATGSKYSATMYFAETYFGADNPGMTGVGSRLFDIYCNGVILIRNFDIFKEAGGANLALAKTFHGLTPNPSGKLVFTFVPARNYACITAIEVDPE